MTYERRGHDTTMIPGIRLSREEKQNEERIDTG